MDADGIGLPQRLFGKYLFAQARPPITLNSRVLAQDTSVSSCSIRCRSGEGGVMRGLLTVDFEKDGPLLGWDLLMVMDPSPARNNDITNAASSAAVYFQALRERLVSVNRALTNHMANGLPKIIVLGQLKPVLAGDLRVCPNRQVERQDTQIYRRKR
jgi:hypothetical protein